MEFSAWAEFLVFLMHSSLPFGTFPALPFLVAGL
jgi:hypothetical protein